VSAVAISLISPQKSWKTCLEVSVLLVKFLSGKRPENIMFGAKTPVLHLTTLLTKYFFSFFSIYLRL